MSIRCQYLDWLFVSRAVSVAVAIVVLGFIPSNTVADSANDLGHCRKLPPFRTLHGIATGNIFSLDSERVVVERVKVMAPSCFWSVLLRYPDGSKGWVSSDYIQLRDKSPAVKQRYYDLMQRSVEDAIRNELGLKVSGIRHVALGGANNPTSYQHRKDWWGNSPLLKRYAQTGHDKPDGPGVLLGFSHQKTIYLSEAVGAFSYQNRAHEILHVLSLPFRKHVKTRALNRLWEGALEYFCYRALLPAFGIYQDPQAPYRGYTQVAQALVERIGEATLSKALFSSMPDALDYLRRQADATKPGLFDAVLRDLKYDRTAEAVRKIRG